MADTETTPGTPAGANTGGEQSSGTGLKLVILILACVLVGFIAFQAGKESLPKLDDENMRKIVGLGRPVVNRLSEQYTDVDGDLIADMPAEPDALVNPATIVFSYIASRDTEDELSGWADFVDHLASVTNKNVEHRVFTDRYDQLRALHDGELHVTGLNTGGVPIAVNAAGFLPTVTPGVEGTASAYRMVVIVPAASPIQRVNDLKGKTIAFTSPSSNSGYKAPLVILESDFGLSVEQDYYIVNSYSHAASIDGVASGKYAAAVTASDLLERAIEQGDISPGAVRVIHESEPFPTAAIGYAHNLSPDLRRAIDQALGSFTFEGTSLAGYFEGQGAEQFVPINYKNDFALIRRIDDAIGFEHVLPAEASEAPSPQVETEPAHELQPQPGPETGTGADAEDTAI